MNRRSFLALLGLSSLVGVASKAAEKPEIDFDAVVGQMGIPAAIDTFEITYTLSGEGDIVPGSVRVINAPLGTEVSHIDYERGIITFRGTFNGETRFRP